MRLSTICAAALFAATPTVVATSIGAQAAPVTAGLASGVTQRSGVIINVGGPYRRYLGRRNCRPYNGPFGYYGNPWCERGWKYTEDRFDSYGYWYYPRPRYRYWRR